MSSPSWALRIGCVRDERQHRLAHIGLNLLSFDSFSRFGAAGPILDRLLPQLCLIIPSINAAATALGAAHQLHTSHSFSHRADEAFAASQYQVALRATQRDCFTQPDGPIPLIMICFILSVAEILLQQEANASLHLRAASNLLQDCRKVQTPSRSVRCDTFDTELRSLEDEIGTILRTVDFQVCSYALSKPPDLPAVSIPLVLPFVTDLSAAHIMLVQLVQACYSFTHTVYQFKYQPQSANPSIYIEQARHIAHLSTWLKQFNRAVLPTLQGSSTGQPRAESRHHALILRVTALSILIHLSCILSPYEMAFNAHAPHFQQIVTDGETIMAMRHGEADGSFKGTDTYRFTTGPGLIQPLFLTAFKCRHPLYRRRAIALLANAGCEGPWSGRREARITSRLMYLKELWTSDSSLEAHSGRSIITGVPARARENTQERFPLQSPTTLPQRWRADVTPNAPIEKPEMAAAPSTDNSSPEPRGRIPAQASHLPVLDIPEAALINNMGMSDDTSYGRPSNRVIVSFTKCRDMEAMLAYPCGRGRGQARSLDAHVFGPCVQNPFWDRWEEVLEFWRGLLGQGLGKVNIAYFISYYYYLTKSANLYKFKKTIQANLKLIFEILELIVI